ncbi:MAG: hypothetical protein PF904_11610 [Kiritimatiellae bacterium]|jgi:hypothetical protein|nr:hypothetical protein [Kiritimatiellia bacterium]
MSKFVITNRSTSKKYTVETDSDPLFQEIVEVFSNDVLYTVKPFQRDVEFEELSDIYINQVLLKDANKNEGKDERKPLGVYMPGGGLPNIRMPTDETPEEKTR